MTRGLYWFEHDLRLSNNAALSAIAQQVEALHCVYIFQPQWFSKNAFGMVHMGKHRYRFIREALTDLSNQLAQQGQILHIYYGDPVSIIADLHQQHAFTHIAKHYHTGVYEQRQWHALQTQCDQCDFSQANSYTLYGIEQLPMDIDQLPDVFSPFRRKVEQHAPPRETLAKDNALASLPPALCSELAGELISTTLPPVQPAVGDDLISGRLIGGATFAAQQLHYYSFDTHALSEYKITRNGLDGWDFSSKLSAWLASGCISAGEVNAAICQYEAAHGHNDSTYWLFFELLWREFYQWQQLKYQAKIYHKNGIQHKTPTGKHNPEMFASWVAGTTDYPIVNACMLQLAHTGFMSNRGRQLVASCLVHELGLDWQYGAAYFEQMLIDFDPASNWGNWQYLAGVGSDPRGLRRFNLAKQTQTYDPNHVFINNWLSYATSD